ncbi:hypothetical protein FPQ18DRAFT_71990 [Pyronema domesticum]|nr:hypothetical protein FPQ18DRAFT_71990 [Pyronema domesticum]
MRSLLDSLSRFAIHPTPFPLCLCLHTALALVSCHRPYGLCCLTDHLPRSHSLSRFATLHVSLLSSPCFLCSPSSNRNQTLHSRVWTSK